MNYNNLTTNITINGLPTPINRIGLQQATNTSCVRRGCFYIESQHQQIYLYAPYIVPLNTKLSIYFAGCRHACNAIRLAFGIIAYRDWDDNGNLRIFYVNFNEQNIQAIQFYSDNPRYNEKLQIVNMNNYYHSVIFSKIEIIVRDIYGNIDNNISANIGNDFHQILMVMNKTDTTLNFNNAPVTWNWYNMNIQPGLTRISNAIQRKQVHMAKNNGTVRCVAEMKCPICISTWTTSKLIVFADVPNNMRVTNINQIINLVRNNININMMPQYCDNCDQNGRGIKSAGIVLSWDIFDPLNRNHIVGGRHRSDLCAACQVGVCTFSARKLNPGRFGTAVSIIRQLYNNYNNVSIENVNGKTIVYMQ